FRTLKHGFGLKAAWQQQSRQVLMRWVTVLAAGYAINQMLAFTDTGAPGRLGSARPLARSWHPHRRADPGRHRPDFTRGRAASLHRGDLGKNRRHGIRHKRIVSAARRQSRVAHSDPLSSFRSRGSDPALRRRSIAWKLQFHDNQGKFRVRTELEQHIWSECTRLIANCTIFCNAYILSGLYAAAVKQE